MDRKRINSQPGYLKTTKKKAFYFKRNQTILKVFCKYPFINQLAHKNNYLLLLITLGY